MPDRWLWAPQAWVDGRWQDAVLLHAGPDGRWAEVTPDVDTPPDGATVLAGPVLPGLVDAHSHAFQRAFAGLAERREHATDDFWSWRDRMYGVALRITPEQLRAVAAQLYVELLCGGYTQVCEFHYLQHDLDGSPYADPATMSWALADAAADAGIGLTVLPVLYERAGFTHASLRPEQRRFATTPAQVLSLQRRLRDAQRPLLNAGVAVHSLRAASPAVIAELIRGVAGDNLPVHIHIAEQTQEVDDCVAATGARPLEWLSRELRLDARWQLVHATQALPAEIDAVAASGAGVVLCPSTEANLGDGLPDLPRLLAAGVPLSIGSDSQAARHWAEELRWLEYGQRLLHRRRNVAAAPEHGEPSTAARLFNLMLHGGARSAGQSACGLERGARADAVVLDPSCPGLMGVPPSHRLDAWVFTADAPQPSEVYVAGRQVVAQGRHIDGERIARRFQEALEVQGSGRF